MVLDKLPVLGRPTSLDNSKARTDCICSTGGGCLDVFFLSSIILSSFSLSLVDGPT